MCTFKVTILGIKEPRITILPPGVKRYMLGAILALPKYVFIAWCLVKHREKFNFIFTKLFFWKN